MINFDNAATTFPKPRSVRQAMEMAMLKYGGNAGRGGHQLTERTSEQVFAAREEAAAFFGGKPENTILSELYARFKPRHSGHRTAQRPCDYQQSGTQCCIASSGSNGTGTRGTVQYCSSFGR